LARRWCFPVRKNPPNIISAPRDCRGNLLDCQLASEP
jgi:hypothetical protein